MAILVLAVLIPAVLVLAGCGAVSAPPPEAVARVDDQWLSRDSFTGYLGRTAGAQSQELSSEVLSKLLDRWLEEHLLARLAVDRGVADESVRPRRALDRLLAASPLPAPKAADVERYYREHQEDYRRLERVRLRQILLDSREVAEEALAELRQGRDFVDVARRYSQGSLGDLAASPEELARGDIPAAFEETIFQLAVGEVSPVVEAEYGYHLFQVEQRLPAEVLPLEAVAEKIRLRLVQEATDRRLRALVEEARNQYPVEVVTDHLPFDYQGSFRTPQLDSE